jgi:exodeoxyribonuclease V alpha subunit
LLPSGASDDPEAGFRSAFAAALRALHQTGGGAAGDGDQVAAAAERVALALQEGASCIDLELAGGEGAALAAALRRSPLVATDVQDGPRPLVLERGRLYLYRYWRYERELAQHLAALNREVVGLDEARLNQELSRLFPAAPAERIDWQKIAAATAALRHLCIISGGPGSGKTTTVARLIVLLLTLQGDLRIALAAPTGRAATRVQEAIRAQLERMRLSDELRARLPAESFTIHRLLGARPMSTVFRHGPERRLPYDVLVVDEASMLDLAVAAKLLAALPEGARLILLGDKDQLASVEAGAVYAELSATRQVSETWARRLRALTGEPIEASAAAPVHPAADAVIWFDRSYRVGEDTPLRRLAQTVNAGDSAGLQTLLAEPDGEMRWTSHLPDPAVLAETLMDGYADFVQALQQGASVPEVFRAFARFRVLCATREGRYGATNLDRLLVESLRRRLGAGHSRDAWFAGRPVLITQNDYAVRLFNGDTGIALASGEGPLQIHFPDETEGTRRIAAGRLPTFAGALATTVHRAQGSEFDAIAVVIDPTHQRALSRALLYTAITRARRSLSLFATPESLEVVSRPQDITHTTLWPS